MVCCPKTPSHYLNQCWHIISKAHSNSSRAPCFSKFSFAQLPEFDNSLIYLRRIKKRNWFKSTCPAGSFTCPGPSGIGKRWALSSYGNYTKDAWATNQKMNLKITYLKFHQTLPGANELMQRLIILVSGNFLQIYTILALVTIFVSYDKSPLISTGNSNATRYRGPYIYSCISALWWYHRALYILLNICPGNGLVLPSTKLLPGQMLTWQYM